MNIRGCRRSDIPHLVDCDKLAYGKYGADEKYFSQKLLSPDTQILVVEEETGPTGFCVFEILDPGQTPKDFCDLRLTEPIDRKWMHIIAFTTKTNYADTDSDTQFLKASEKIAQENGCEIFCVPLTPPGRHPFDDATHDVFGFWDRNEYKLTGNLKWNARSTEKVECNLYMKRNIPE